MSVIVGVSMPRCGHHFVERLLRAAYDGVYEYCEFYSPSNCCKTVPCKTKADLTGDRTHVFYQKNHDIGLTLPRNIACDMILIQYRAPLDQSVANFDNYTRVFKHDDTASSMPYFLASNANYYIQFFRKWIQVAPENVFLLKYEDLCDRPVETIRQIGRRISTPISETALENRLPDIRATGGGGHTFVRRDYAKHRFFDQDIFAATESLIFQDCEGLDYVPRFQQKPADEALRVMQLLYASEKAKDNRLERVRLLRRALEIQPNMANIFNEIAITLLSLGKKNDALRASERALALDPRHPAYLHVRGVIAFALEDFRGAEQYQESAIASGGESAPYVTMLERARNRQKDKATSLPTSEETEHLPSRAHAITPNGALSTEAYRRPQQYPVSSITPDSDKALNDATPDGPQNRQKEQATLSPMNEESEAVQSREQTIVPEAATAAEPDRLQQQRLRPSSASDHEIEMRLTMLEDAQGMRRAQVDLKQRKTRWLSWPNSDKLPRPAPAPARRSSASPHPLFDVVWYRRKNPDLLPVQANFQHYITKGWQELRTPHPLFSIEYYLRLRPDVLKCGLEPLSHFIINGWKESSNPHPLFDVSFYLSQDPPLDGYDPLTHYVIKGWRQGLRPNPAFQPTEYIERYADVRKAGVEPLTHFLAHGVFERRLYSSTHEFGSLRQENEALRLLGPNFDVSATSRVCEQPEPFAHGNVPIPHGRDQNGPSDSDEHDLPTRDPANSRTIEREVECEYPDARADREPTLCVVDQYEFASLRSEPDYEIATRDFDGFEYSIIYDDIARMLNFDQEACRQHWISSGRSEGRYGPGVRLFAERRASLQRVLQKPFGLNIYGPFDAISGLGTAARNLADAICSNDIPHELHIFDVSNGIPRITRKEWARPGTYRINLILANADQIENVVRMYPAGYFDNSYNIAQWAWELAAFRPDWYACFAAVDEVWTYSDFVVDSISAISPVPVRKIPIPVVTSPTLISTEAAREWFMIPQGKFVFLTVFDAGSTSSRKNPISIINAFCSAFSKVEDVFLLVKFHSPVNVEQDLLRELYKAISDIPNAALISDRLSEEEMAKLRAASDCLISAHRSEGYGLNIAEFMALGKTVVATNYSGNLEFFSERTGYPVDYRLIEIQQQAGPYLPGYVWAEPDVESLVEQMRRAFLEREQPERREAARARAEELSPKAIGKAIREHLEQMDLDADSDAPSPTFAKYLTASRNVGLPAVCRPLAGETRDELRLLKNRPRLSVIVPVYNVPPGYLRQCINSVRAQTYPFWELCLCDDASTNPDTVAELETFRGVDPRIRIRRLAANTGISRASNAAAEIATGEFLVLLDNDDVMLPDALMEIVRALNMNASLDCIYTDEEKIDERGNRIDHFLKPDWSPEHLESVMYVLHMLAVRKRLFFDLGGFRPDFDGAQDYDLMLRISRATARIHHVQKVVYQWRAIPGSAAAVVDAKPYALEAGLRALREHARVKYGLRSCVEKGLLPGTFRVRRPLRADIPVTLLILTNNGEIDLPGRGRIRIIDNFVDSILAHTAYPNYQIVVVDNSRLSEGQRRRFHQLGVRVENFTGPVVPFNYSAKANFSIDCAQTDHIVILNDDMEVFDDDWLTALMELAQDENIGGVGGRLFHADGTIQHVGMVLGVNGAAAHPYHGFPGDFIGYNGFTHIIRNYSAVTGACFATRKSVIARVGGFDERLAIDFNDTDLCLRILEHGYRIVYTPFASLRHFESVSAKRNAQNPAEVALFNSRWRQYVENDPYYNIHLSKTRNDYALRADP